MDEKQLQIFKGLVAALKVLAFSNGDTWTHKDSFRELIGSIEAEIKSFEQ